MFNEMFTTKLHADVCSNAYIEYTLSILTLFLTWFSIIQFGRLLFKTTIKHTEQ